VVGRRDAYWASSGSAVTNSLLLSAVWVVGAFFADRNAPVPGGILNQQGVGNSTVGSLIQRMYWTNNARTSTPNLTYRKIFGFNPIIVYIGKKELEFFFNH